MALGLNVLEGRFIQFSTKRIKSRKFSFIQKSTSAATEVQHIVKGMGICETDSAGKLRTLSGVVHIRIKCLIKLGTARMSGIAKLKTTIITEK